MALDSLPGKDHMRASIELVVGEILSAFDSLGLTRGWGTVSHKLLQA